MPDNETLLFSSNGLGGYGSQDVFLSKRLDETWKKWTKTQNLTEKINTEGKELSFRFTSIEEAVFVSTQNSDVYLCYGIHKLFNIVTNSGQSERTPVDK